MNFNLLDLLYFYLCTLVTGPPLIPELLTLTALYCINIIIIAFIIITIAYDFVSFIAHQEVEALCGNYLTNRKAFTVL